jgi:hypothetical protein
MSIFLPIIVIAMLAVFSVGVMQKRRAHVERGRRTQRNDF